jgi:hypothetical protein
MRTLTRPHRDAVSMPPPSLRPASVSGRMHHGEMDVAVVDSQKEKAS